MRAEKGRMERRAAWAALSPGIAYTQAIVPGYNFVYEVDGASYEVHSDIDGTQMVGCSP